jgi:hypothetical protein
LGGWDGFGHVDSIFDDWLAISRVVVDGNRVDA